MQQRKIILASRSPRRVELLAQLGVQCDILPADIDESCLPGEDPAVYVQRLATAKAMAIAKAHATKGLPILAADTTAVSYTHLDVYKRQDLFIKMLHHIEIGHEISHHVALISMLQILDLIDRGDLKVDLLQELDRHKVQLSFLQNNPNIDQLALATTLSSLDRCATALRSDHQKLGQSLRDNDWLMSVKQRTSIPGGVCEFDLPSYRHWLYLGTAVSYTHLDVYKRQSSTL